MARTANHKLRILYVANLGPMSKCTQRSWAMERLGHEVHRLDTWDYEYGGNPLVWRIRLRTLTGQTIDRLNRDVLAAAERIRPDLIWFDKAIFVRAETIARLRASGIYCAHQIEDNPFGPRDDPGWGILRAALREYDVFMVPRKTNLPEYRAAGARDVFYLPFGYEPTLQFPPPEGWSDKDRPYDAVYIGFPHDRRAEFFLALWKKHGIAVNIWGDPRWMRKFPRNVLPADARDALIKGGRVSFDDYRKILWQAKFCFSFVTHSNQDEIGGRSLEIAGAGALLLAEDVPGHRAYFEPDREAILFRSVDDCAAQIRRYLPDEAARNRIAGAGLARAVSSGYSYDAVIAPALEYVCNRLPGGSAGCLPHPPMSGQSSSLKKN
jgi:hypothetical protein